MFSPIALLSILVFGTSLAFLPLSLKKRHLINFFVVGVAAVVASVMAVQGMTANRFFGPDDVWFIDGVGALMLLSIATVSVGTAAVSARYLDLEHRAGVISLPDTRLYYSCLPLIIAAAYTASIANNASLVWLSLEISVLTTVLLVAFYRKRSAIEAAWKYLLLCSLGLLLALVGLFLLAAAIQSPPGTTTLLITQLQHIASRGDMNGELVKFAFIFLFVGYGVKIGWVPLHTWLPDAHSRAPSPISALLSGVLLSTAFIALWRLTLVTNLALGDGGAWSSKFFMLFGLASITLPALMSLAQRNYKRLFAHVTLQQMGLLAFAASLGPIGFIPVAVHLPVHALAQSGLFFAAGEIFLKYKTTESARIRDLALRYPRLSALLLLLLLVVFGLPPAGFFVSKILMIGYGTQRALWPTLIVIAALIVMSVNVLRQVFFLFWGERPQSERVVEEWNIAYTVLLLEIVLVCLIGIFALTQFGLQLFVNLVASSIPVSI